MQLLAPALIARMASTDPIRMGAELEASQLRVLLDGVDRADELVDVDAVDYVPRLRCHGLVSFALAAVPWLLTA